MLINYLHDIIITSKVGDKNISSSGNLNIVSQIIVAGQAIDNVELNNAVINFAKERNDNASRSAIRSYHKYWQYSLLLWIVLIIMLFAGIFIIKIKEF